MLIDSAKLAAHLCAMIAINITRAILACSDRPRAAPSKKLWIDSIIVAIIAIKVRLPLFALDSAPPICSISRNNSIVIPAIKNGKGYAICKSAKSLAESLSIWINPAPKKTPLAKASPTGKLNVGFDAF